MKKLRILLKKLKKSAFEHAKKLVKFRIFLRNLIIFKRYIFYKCRSFGVKVDKKTVIFSSYDGRAYACSPKAIYLYMLNDERFGDYHFVWAFRNSKEYSFLSSNPRTTVVDKGSVKFDKYMAKAGYWIFNYRAPDHISPRQSQTYVQCWHGTPLKRLGYDLKGTKNATNSQREIYKKYKTDAKKFKYILSPSAFASEKFLTAWNLRAIGKEDCVIEEGYPRNDFLFTYTDEDVEKIKERLNLSHCDKKIILYAPTWRDDQHDSLAGFTYKMNVDFDKLSEKLSDKYIILFRAHYLISNTFDFEKYSGFIFDVSHYDDINELYVISDMLVTDYSSVFFDYANLRRPIVFYMYDYEFYKDELRGFYISVDELPGSIVTTDDDLIREILDTDVSFEYDSRYQSFNNKYNCLDDGKAAQRVVNRLFQQEQGV